MFMAEGLPGGGSGCGVLGLDGAGARLTSAVGGRRDLGAEAGLLVCGSDLVVEAFVDPMTLAE
jgi:hypothetical protein